MEYGQWTRAKQKETTAHSAVLKLGPTSPTINEHHTKNDTV